MSLLVPRMPKSWDPASSVSQLHDEMSRWLNAFDEGWGAPQTNGHSVWKMPLEVWEDGDTIVMRADLPGVEDKDIDVSVLGDALTIAVERRAETAGEDKHHLREIRYGKFERRLQLPSEADTEKLKATYRNGVLEIRIPKRPEAKPKQIKVEVKS